MYENKCKKDHLNCDNAEKVAAENNYIQENVFLKEDDCLFCSNEPVSANQQLNNLEQETDLVTYTVMFDSAGGTVVSPQVLELGALVDEPSTPQKENKDLFAGWFYLNDGVETAWNFAENTVFGDLQLYAKWEPLNCQNIELLNQVINNVKKVSFNIAINNKNILWYVNDIIQNNTGNTFEFEPPEATGIYKVYCIIDGIKSKTHIVNVEYYVPTSLSIYVDGLSDNNIYTFSIEGGKYIDGYKCVWYMSLDEFSEEYQEVAFGKTSFTLKLEKSCKIFAMYKGEQDVQSNAIKITPKFIISGTLIFIIVIACSFILAVVVLIVISRRKYKSYY